MAERKTKLHELLAVISSVRPQADKVRTDLIETFRKKHHLFSEQRKTFQPLEEGAEAVTEEVSELQTTVSKELSWISEHLIKLADIQNQIAEANTVARADVVLDSGEVVLHSVAATSLLELEKFLTEVQVLFAAAPTLDPAKGFKSAPSRGNGISEAREVVKDRTKKQSKVVVKYPATKEHPAQTEMVTEDVVVGRIRQQEWSGMMTPAAKARLLERVENLTRAVKRARSRANEVEIEKGTGSLGKAIFDYLLMPVSEE